MNAEEIRKLSIQNSPVLKEIENEAKKGGFSCIFYNLDQTLIKYLRSLNYQVSSGSCGLDGSHCKVSW